MFTVICLCKRFFQCAQQMFWYFFFPSPGTILDHLVGEDIIADYLLYSLNRLGKFRCVSVLNYSWVSFQMVSVFMLLHITVIVYCMCVFVCSYVEKYDLQEPSDDIQHVLKRIAVKLGKTQRVKAITGVGKKVLIIQKSSS